MSAGLVVSSAPAMQLIIKETSSSSGRVLQAESTCGRFSWSYLNESQIHDHACARALTIQGHARLNEFGSDPIPDDLKQTVRAFWLALRNANDESIRQWCAQNAARERPRVRNPAYAHLSDAQIKDKEREYDLTHNEGAEGFNPYRDHLWVDAETQRPKADSRA